MQKNIQIKKKIKNTIAWWYNVKLKQNLIQA